MEQHGNKEIVLLTNLGSDAKDVGKRGDHGAPLRNKLVAHDMPLRNPTATQLRSGCTQPGLGVFQVPPPSKQGMCLVTHDCTRGG